MMSSINNFAVTIKEINDTIGFVNTWFMLSFVLLNKTYVRLAIKCFVKIVWNSNVNEVCCSHTALSLELWSKRVYDKETYMFPSCVAKFFWPPSNSLRYSKLVGFVLFCNSVFDLNGCNRVLTEKLRQHTYWISRYKRL